MRFLAVEAHRIIFKGAINNVDHQIIKPVSQIFKLTMKDPKEIINFVSKSYHIHHSAMHVKLVDFFPLSSSGKPLYADLLKNHLLLSGIK